MNSKLKKRQAVIVIVVFVFLLIIGGFFWWKWKIPEPTYVNSTDYEIKDTSEGKIIENKEEGLTFKVPEGWGVKKYDEGISLFSPEVEFDQYGDVLIESLKEKGGCGVGVKVVEYKSEPAITIEVGFLRGLINRIQENSTVQESPITIEKREVIKVDDKLALKRIFFHKGEQKSISVEIPINNTIYSFENGFIFSEKCLQKFNKFLETVLINK